MVRTVELDARGAEEFFSRIEEQIQQDVQTDGAAGKSGWQRTDDENFTFTYNFYGKDDKTLNLNVDRNSRWVSITYGQF